VGNADAEEARGREVRQLVEETRERVVWERIDQLHAQEERGLEAMRRAQLLLMHVRPGEDAVRGRLERRVEELAARLGAIGTEMRALQRQLVPDAAIDQTGYSHEVVRWLAGRPVPAPAGQGGVAGGPARVAPARTPRRRPPAP